MTPALEADLWRGLRTNEMTLCIATNSIPGDLSAKLSAISAAGFAGVELTEHEVASFDGSAKDCAALITDHGLKLVALRLEEPPEQFERSLGLAADLGTDLLLVPEEAYSAETVHGWEEVAKLAADRGIRIALISPLDAMAAGYAERALNLIQEVDHPSLGLCLNSLHVLADGARPASIGDLPAARVFHVQISDAPKIGFAANRYAKTCSLLPGQGDLNLAGFVRILARNGYSGAWSLDGPGGTQPVKNAAPIANDGYRAMVNLLNRVRRREPNADFDIPKLTERVYPTGFEFIEFAVQGDDAKALTDLLSSLRFRMERRHVSKSVELWRQGAINIVVNTERRGFARSAYLQHGSTVCDMGLRVSDADDTIARAAALGAPRVSQPVGVGELDIPAIRGVGGNVVHFIDEKSNLHRVWDIEFNPVMAAKATQPAGLRRIDHVAQTMKYEEMQSWLLYYISTFEMEKSPIVDVADPAGVVRSQAIESPEGEVRLNLNGAESGRTFAGAFLADQHGAGVQHIAFQTDDIFETSGLLAASGFPRLAISPHYYDALRREFELDAAFADRLAAGDILYDRRGGGEYFQIYSEAVFGGFFFEIVERRAGYAGYGARNASTRLEAQAIHQQKYEARENV